MESTGLEPLLARYRDHGDLLALLNDAQTTCGGLSGNVIDQIALGLGMPASDLYGIVSFYSFLSTRPVGRHTIRVCQSVPCRLSGGADLLGAVERSISIKPGETSADGRFSLELTNCLGACDHGPALMIDEHRFGDLDSAGVEKLLQNFTCSIGSLDPTSAGHSQAP